MKNTQRDIQNRIVRLFAIHENKRLKYLGLGVYLPNNKVLTKVNARLKETIDTAGKKTGSISQYFIDFPFIEPNQLIKANFKSHFTEFDNKCAIFETPHDVPKSAKRTHLARMKKVKNIDTIVFFADDGKLSSIKTVKPIEFCQNGSELIIKDKEFFFKRIPSNFSMLVFNFQNGRLIGFLDCSKDDSSTIISIKAIDHMRSSMKQYFFKTSIFEKIKKFVRNRFVFRIIEAFVVIVGLVSGIIGVINFVNPEYLSPMSSQLNIVVLPFAVDNCEFFDGRRIQREIPSQMATIIRESSKDFNISFDVRDPSIYPVLPFKYSELIAEKTARDNNAQIVIYGKVICQENNDAIVQTRLFISTENFGEALELIGEDVAGQLDFAHFTIYGGEQYSGNAYLAQQKDLQARLQVYTLVIYGIGSYINQDSSSAIDYFLKALDQKYWAVKNGQETIYLLLGNAYQRRATEYYSQNQFDEITTNLDTAEAYYLLSNSSSVANGKGEYARAYIGLSGVEQLRSILRAQIEHDEDQINIESLQKAFMDLQKATDCPNAPASADIEEKIDYGYAQIALIRYLTTRDIKYVNEADYYYSRVIDAYQRGKSSYISEIVALSFRGKALIAHEKDLKRAISYLESAYSVARNRSLKAQLMVMWGDYLFEDEQVNLAIEKYQEALNMRDYLEKVVPGLEILRIEQLLLTLEESDYQ